MRKLSIVVALSLIAALLPAHRALAQTLTRVFVQAGAGGFAASGANDTALDLRKALAGKSRTLRVVEAPEDADVVVRIDSRNVRKETASINTYENKSNNGKSSTSTTVPTVRNVNVLHATLLAGDFQMPLETESALSWRLAASDMASAVDHWAKENFANLIERRAQRAQPAAPSSAPSRPPAPDDRSQSRSQDRSQGESTSIAPGMTEAQVLDAMGAPEKKIAFGAKSMWNYRGMQVIFEAGKVTDVKF